MNKLRFLWIFVVMGVFAIGMITEKAFGFNLIQDVQEYTQWTLGENASAGTSVDVRNGQYDASEFAGITSYRMLSLWYGGIQIPQSDNTVKFTDAAKFGLNLNYFLKGFVNKPPEFLNRLVIGPAVTIPVVSSPHKVGIFVDINYVFGNKATLPVPPPATTPTP